MRRHHRAFTLLELIFTIGIVLVIASLVVPAVGSALKSARRAECLNNLRMLSMAHVGYTTDQKGLFIDAGLAHGGLVNEELAWVNTLHDYYDDELLVHSPLDTSPHWPLDDGGKGIEVNGELRRTSYGFNNYLSRTKSPNAFLPGVPVHDRISRVKNHAATVLLMIMAYESANGFAVADHVHVEQWEMGGAPALAASDQVQIDAVAGPPRNDAGRSNYASLDGHVATHAFAEVYIDRDNNRLDPEVSKRFTTTVGLD